jgi:hypothetical protein
MAALREQMFRIGFLKISAAYFAARDLRGDGEHWNTAPVAIVKPVNQMQIARSGASGTDCKLSRKVCFGPGGERCRLFMPDVNPSNLLLFANRIRDSIHRVARNAIYPFNSRLGECIYE